MRTAAGRAAAGAAALLVLALVAAACGEGNRSDFALKAGVLVPLTGPRDTLGKASEFATQLAQDQIVAAIQEAGAKHSVDKVEHDEGPDAGVTFAAAEKLKNEKVGCVIGPYSSSTLPALTNQVFVPADIPVISPAASGDPIGGIKDGDLINRTILPDADQGPALATLMDRELEGGAKGKAASIGAFDSNYGRNLTKSFSDAWRKLGGTVADSVYWRDKSDYSPEVKKLTRKRPDAFVFFDGYGTFGRVLGQLNAEKSFSAKKSWATDALADPQLTVNPALFGLRGVAPGSPADTEAGKAFDQLFKKKAGPEMKRQSFDAQAFDAYILCYLGAVAAGSASGGKLADQLQKVSGPPGQKYTWEQLPDAVRALEHRRDIDYEGASGPIDLNDRGDPTAGTYDAYRIAKERIEIIGQVPFPPEV